MSHCRIFCYFSLCDIVEQLHDLTYNFKLLFLLAIVTCNFPKNTLCNKEIKQNNLSTCHSVTGNCETGRIVVFDSVQTLCNHQAPVSVRLDVAVRKVDSFQSVVTRVERVTVQDERRVHGEECWVLTGVFCINVEEVAMMSDVTVWTVGYHQRVTLRTQSLWHVVPRTASNQHEGRSVLLIRRQNNLVVRRHMHSLSGFSIHRSCNCHNNTHAPV